MRELENKVDRLEALLQALGRRVEDHIQLHDSGRAATVAASPASRISDQPQQVTKLHDDNRRHFTISLDGSPDSQRLSSDPKIYDRMQYDRTSETMSVQSMTTRTTALGDVAEYPRSPNVSGQPGVAYNNYQSALDFDLPPYDLLYSLVDLYFKHVNTWCPILDRKLTFDTFFNSSVLDDADRNLLHAIVATSLRFCKAPGLTLELRTRYHSAAKQKVLLYGLENPTVKALQALVILALDFLGVSDGPQSWNILAILIGNIRRLRLNAENSLILNSSPPFVSPGTLQEFMLPRPTSWIEDEGRRRLFWMVYILDRYVAVANISDFLLCESEVGRSLPCRYDLFSKNEPVETRWFVSPGRSEMIVNRPENLGSFSHHCDVLRTMSRVQAFLRKPVDICSLSEVQQWQTTYRELDGELNAWLYDLPDEYSRVSHLCHSDPTSKISNWIMIHAAFVTAVLRLHSCAAYPSVRSHIFAPSFIAMQRCLAAVESLREIVQDVVNTGMLSLLGPHFAFALWVSARLLLVHASSTGTEVDPKIQFFITTLEQMGPYWPVAHRYAQLLDRIIRASREVTSPAPAGSSIMVPKALAALRRSAYDVYLILSQRPSPTTKEVSAHELEYFEVFEFFNCPRLPAGLLSNPNIHESLRNIPGSPSYFTTSGGFGMTASEPDWLSYRQSA